MINQIALIGQFILYLRACYAAQDTVYKSRGLLKLMLLRELYALVYRGALGYFIHKQKL